MPANSTTLSVMSLAAGATLALPIGLAGLECRCRPAAAGAGSANEAASQWRPHAEELRRRCSAYRSVVAGDHARAGENGARSSSQGGARRPIAIAATIGRCCQRSMTGSPPVPPWIQAAMPDCPGMRTFSKADRSVSEP